MCFVCVSAAREAGDHPNHIANSAIIGSENIGYSAGVVEKSQYTDAMLLGTSWSGDQGAGVAATITYTFSLSGYDSAIVYDDNPVAFNSAQQAAAIGAMDKMEAFANVTFVEASNPSAANITFYIGDFDSYNASGLAGYYFTNTSTGINQTTAATVGMDSDYTDFTTEGTFSYTTLLHELGHAVGLKHPGDYGGSEGPFLPSDIDNTAYTVMSYNDSDGNNGTNPDNFQLLDIEAIQYLYGAVETTYTGGDTEGTSGNDVHTLTSALDYKAGLGADSVVGSSGADTIYGGRSRADSEDGNDTLFGGDAADAVFGNAGNDILYGDGAFEGSGDGADEIWGGKGVDTVYGGGGADSIGGGGDRYNPDDDGDFLYGGGGNDEFTGNGGNDLIWGEDGNDWIHGGAADDTIDGGNGNDTINGGIGNDSITGGAGTDRFEFSLSNGEFDVITDYSSGEVVQIDVDDPSAVSSINDIINASFTGNDGSSDFVGFTAIVGGDFLAVGHQVNIYGVSSLDQVSFEFV